MTFPARLRLLFAWPDHAKWKRALAIMLAGSIALGLAASLSGLVSWQPQPLTVANLAVIALLFAIPAFGEELLFRGILFPSNASGGGLWLAVASTALFILWHPFQSWSGVGPEWSGLFLDPGFLICAAIGGITLAALRLASRSLWPGIIFHWLFVVCWKMVFGGPF